MAVLVADCGPRYSLSEMLSWAGAEPVTKAAPRRVTSDPAQALLDMKTVSGVSLDEMRVRLATAPPDWVTDRDKWIRVGAALHHETGGSDEGLALFDDWSSAADNYGGCATAWESFNTSRGNLLTWRGLWFGETQGIEQVGTLEELLGEIRSTELVGAEKSIFIKAAVERAKGLGLKLSEARVRREMPVPKSGFAFIEADDCFFEGATRLRSKTGTLAGMKAKLGMSTDEFIKSCKIYRDADYRPDGDLPEDVLNTFQMWPVAEPDMTSPEAAMIIDHYTHMIGYDETDILFQYLKRIYTNPGKKMTWSIILMGDQGSGKSLIGKTLIGMLGTNATEVSSNVLAMDWGNWLEDKCFVMGEELSITGKGSAERMNELKNLVTSNSLYINRKGGAMVERKNFVNLMFNTDDMSALKFKAHEMRRWCLMGCKKQERFDGEHFKKLAACLKTHLGAVLSAWEDTGIADLAEAPKVAFAAEYFNETKATELELLDSWLHKQTPVNGAYRVKLLDVKKMFHSEQRAGHLLYPVKDADVTSILTVAGFERKQTNQERFWTKTAGF